MALCVVAMTIGAAGVMAAARAAGPQGGANAGTPPVPIIVELFTSEGCSSCPPADQFLIDLATKPALPQVHLITLSEHVDYWDHDGWRDPFSSASFTARQTGYAQSRVSDGVSTPQMIVDGVTSFIGSDRQAALRAITRAAATPKPALTATWGPSASKPSVSVSLGANQVTEHASIVLAITEDGLTSNVTRGENAGRTIAHASVTRRLGTVGQTSKDGSFALEVPVSIDRTWNPRALHVIVFAQLPNHHIVAATSVPAPDTLASGR